MALLDLSLSGPRTHTGKLWDFVARSAALYRQREALRRLDDRALADIGLTRHEAEREAARPVWDVPATWRE